MEMDNLLIHRGCALEGVLVMLEEASSVLVNA